MVLFQELKQVVLHEGCNKVPPIKWHCMTILWNLVYTYLVKPYFLIIINAWELKISICGNLTANFILHLNAFKKGVLLHTSSIYRWVNTIVCMCTAERMFSYILVCFVFSEYYDSSIVCVFHAGSSHNKRHASQPLRYEHMQCVNILFTSVVIQNFMRKWIRE